MSTLTVHGPVPALRRLVSRTAAAISVLIFAALGLTCCRTPEPCNTPPCAPGDGGAPDGGAACPTLAALSACAAPSACDARARVCLVVEDVECAFRSAAFVSSASYAREWRPHMKEWLRLLEGLSTTDDVVGMAAGLLRPHLTIMDEGAEDDRGDENARVQLRSRAADLARAAGATCTQPALKP